MDTKNRPSMFKSLASLKETKMKFSHWKTISLISAHKNNTNASNGKLCSVGF